MEYILIFIGAVFVNNVVLSQFLGICPFLGVSKKVQTSIGMGAAVTFVLTLATMVTFLVNKYVLVPQKLEFAQTIVFILIIAALVQMVEIILKKISPSLYQALGVFLPLITTNCCVLGVAILVCQKDMNFIQGVIYAISIAIGFTLAMVTFAGIREQLAKTTLPKAMSGMPAALLVAGILAMSFMGFSGMDKGIKKATEGRAEAKVEAPVAAPQEVDAVESSASAQDSVKLQDSLATINTDSAEVSE